MWLPGSPAQDHPPHQPVEKSCSPNFCRPPLPPSSAIPTTPAGVDVHAEDSLGKMALTSAGILARDRFVFEACAQAGAPVAAAIGGGYCPDHERIVDRHGEVGGSVVQQLA